MESPKTHTALNNSFFEKRYIENSNSNEAKILHIGQITSLIVATLPVKSLSAIAAKYIIIFIYNVIACRTTPTVKH